MDKIEFAGLTDEQIDALSTDELRAAAGDHLESWNRGTTKIAEFKITEELLITPGLLTELEQVISLLRTAYRDRGPKIEVWGEADLTVWEPDDDLRRRLRRKRDDAAKEIAESEEVVIDS